jgi:hypothetical protein
LWILARVLSPRLSSGSYYVSVDGGEEQLWDVGAQLSAGGKWEWQEVSGTGTGTGRRQFMLAAGTHTFTFRGGAVNTYLDALVFTNETSAAPPATLPTMDPTPPTRFSGKPFGALPAGSNSASLTLETNEFATCRYSAAPGLGYAAMTSSFTNTGAKVHSTQVSGLTNGTHYAYFVRCQDATGNANWDDMPLYFSVGVPGQSPTLYAQYFEAESGTIASPMNRVAGDSQASGGQYIRSVHRDDGTATYSVTVPNAGTYFLWGRVSSPSSTVDSFFVSFDGGPEDVWQSSWPRTWEWARVSGQADGSAATGGFRPFNLTAGTHILKIRGGAANSFLDTMVLTNDSTFVPN